MENKTFGDFNIHDYSNEETLNRALKMAVFHINETYKYRVEKDFLYSEDIADVERAVHIIEMVQNIKGNMGG